MAIKAKVQRDYLLTEASISLPAQVSEIDEILRAAGMTARMVVLYNKGTVGGINIEQRSKVAEGKTAEVRQLLGVEDKSLSG